MVALVLARATLRKFGGDSVAETRSNVEGYLRSVAARSGADRAIDPAARASG
jgi:chorismate synthase